MIVSRLAGGLGNQMFQYALGRRLADDRETDLVLDISGYKNQDPRLTHRHYELAPFAIRAGLDETGQLVPPLDPSAGPGVRPGLVQEKVHAFDPHVLAVPDGTFLNGYWQSELYFKDIRSQILKDFSFAEEPDATNMMTLEAIRESNAVSLHVRRGDYVTNDYASSFHGTKGLDYYSDAIAIVAAEVTSPHFFVFSDDPTWGQEHLEIDHPTTFVTHNDADTGYEDLRLMSGCHHHILANSSFGWWGAWLNPRPDKIVIAPRQWFDDTSYDTRDVCPEAWIQI